MSNLVAVRCQSKSCLCHEQLPLELVIIHCSLEDQHALFVILANQAYHKCRTETVDSGPKHCANSQRCLRFSALHNESCLNLLLTLDILFEFPHIDVSLPLFSFSVEAGFIAHRFYEGMPQFLIVSRV